jgi:hypothetical protein
MDEAAPSLAFTKTSLTEEFDINLGLNTGLFGGCVVGIRQ